MTPRSPKNAWTRRAALTFIASSAGLLTLPGCDPRTLFYFLQPFEPTIPAPGPSLKGKKVVILTTASANALGASQAIDREINRELATILKANVKKIDLVEPDKVWSWVEAHPTWTDPADAAKAFEADIVIFLEISNFQIEDPKSPGLFEGNSSIHIQVFELAHPKNTKGKPNTAVPKESSSIYEDQRDTVFPIRGPIPAGAGVSRPAFKNKFTKLVATEVSWHFIEHAPGDDIQDVKFNNN